MAWAMPAGHLGVGVVGLSRGGGGTVLLSPAWLLCELPRCWRWALWQVCWVWTAGGGGCLTYLFQPPPPAQLAQARRFCGSLLFKESRHALFLFLCHFERWSGAGMAARPWGAARWWWWGVKGLIGDGKAQRPADYYTPEMTAKLNN